MANEKPNAPDLMVVETKGDIMLQDVSGDQIVEAHRPSVVRNTTFIQQRISSKQLSVVEDSTKMPDAELEKKWSKGNYTKSKKQPVEPPKATPSAPSNPSAAPAPAADPSVNLEKPREQNEGESDEDYLKYLADFDEKHPKAAPKK